MTLLSIEDWNAKTQAYVIARSQIEQLRCEVTVKERTVSFVYSRNTHVTFTKGLCILPKTYASWSGTSYSRIHFLPFTRDGRGYAQQTPFIQSLESSLC